jgi:ATP-binding cassette, subfamily B, bacterial
MLMAGLIAAGICLVSLTLGLAVRVRVARAPVGGTSGSSAWAGGTRAGGPVPDRWRTLARALLWPDRWLAVLAVWLMILDTVLALTAPWPLLAVVDYGLGHRPAPSWLPGPAAGSPLRLAAVAAGAGLLLLALGAVAGYLVTFLTGTLGERMAARLRTAVVAHVLRAVPGQVTRYPLGELTSRVGSDAAAVSDTVVAAVDTLLPDSAVLVGMAVVTALLDWRLTLVVLGVIPLYALTARMRNRALRGAQAQSRARSGELATLAAGLLARVPAVQVFGRASDELGSYEQASSRAAGAAVTALDASARFAPITDTLPGLGLAAALVTGTIEVASGRLTLGGLLVFLAYLSSLTGPVRSLARLSAAVARGSVSRDRVAELLGLPVLTARGPRHARDGGGPGITLDRVTFGHRAGQPVLAGASLRVPPGSFLCLTGPSGTGKSTLLSLLVRLADPAGGRIMLDGRDIATIPLPQLRELITLVPQDPWLHAGTIADNIGYGRPGATRAQIMTAAELAGVDTVAAGLPAGYDTPVGEHGGQLSGGQQRRVAVARALLRDAPVLLLDEPTAGLDPVTEARLIDGLLAATRGKTLILVTHQPRLTARADQVVRLADGTLTPVAGLADMTGLAAPATPLAGAVALAG